MSNISFTCPYCGKPTTVTDPDQFSNWCYINLTKSRKGEVGLSLLAISCPNPKCRELSLKVSLTKSVIDHNYNHVQSTGLATWQLLPESQAKVLPDYIPTAIREDYYEACRIRDLSPKSSATLARRCLQGMIRDFWKIKKRTLKLEVDELKKKVDPVTWAGIDAIRSVGNIGAHMEKNIDLIVGVEPEEAQLLIGLIESLIEDWYVNRKHREEQSESLRELAAAKKALKAPKKEEPAVLPSETDTAGD